MKLGTIEKMKIPRLLRNWPMLDFILLVALNRDEKV